MARKEDRGTKDDNVVRFDFRDKLRKQHDTRRRKEWMLGLAAFSIVFAGGMLALNWPMSGLTSTASSELAPKLLLVGGSASPRFELCGVTRRTCVVDGDTFWLEGQKIRIADIDTPEISEPKCDSEYQLGMKATYRLRDLLNESAFEVRPIGSRDEDRFGRKLRVIVRHGQSLGDQLVSEGLARTWTGRREPWC
ncbi:thermonuclease family protein [Novosphingobium sp.]|uniref:thermonuclease family protein n=1 Tax=Novosphingobium sp. TaxID=1874826 RepID=UPI00262272D9|nr:thermonuclease family protein [Novosphingobium sp.]